MDDSVRQLLHYHKSGTEHLSRALTIDENSGIIGFN
jgi:hypothetical protein